MKVNHRLKPTQRMVALPCCCLLLLMSITLTGCGGGGGGGDDTQAGSGVQTLSLSSERAYPGQPLYVTNTGVSKGEQAEVMFTNVDGTVIPVLTFAENNGELIVVVPPLFNASGVAAAGQWQVSVNGRQATESLTVEGFPGLGTTTEGAVIHAMFTLARQRTAEAIANLSIISAQTGIAVDTLAATLADQIAWLDEQIEELEDWGELTVVIDGRSVILQADTLDVVDNWLLSCLFALDAVSSQNQELETFMTTASGQSASNSNPDYFQYMYENWQKARQVIAGLPAHEQSIRIRDIVESGLTEPLEEGLDAAALGIAGLGAYISLATSAVALLGDTAIVAAAQATNVAAAKASALLSGFLASLTQKNTDAFLSGDRDRFDGGQEMLSQAVRVGSAYTSTLPGAPGQLSTLLNNGLAAKDVLTAAEIQLCDIAASPSSLCWPGTAEGSLNILNFQNFDGQFDQGTYLDPARADIKITGGVGFPLISWPGNAVALQVVASVQSNALLYGIVSLQDEDNNLIPFGNSVRYGNYAVPYTEPAGDLGPAPALVQSGYYVIQVTRSDFASASLLFQLQ